MEVKMSEAARTGPWSNFATPLKHRSFRLLWIGQWVSVLGSSITMVLIPLVVYSLTGSTTIMGLTMTMYMLPNVLILPFSGWIVDRLDRVRLVLLTDAVRFLIMAGAAALMLSDAMTIPLLFAGVAVYGLMDGIFYPAYSAIRAQLFTPDIRNSANALTQMSNQAVRLLGPAAGGLIIAVSSAGIGFGLDALTYAASFVCFLLLGKAFVGKFRPGASVKIESSSFWTDFKEGFAVLKSHAWLWVTILAFSLINICYSGVVTVLIPWLIKIHYGYDAYWYGLAMAGSGAGAMLSAVVFGSRKSWTRRGLLAYGGAFLGGLALLLMPLVAWPPALLLLMVLEGFGIMMFSLIWETSLQELVPADAFGRVVSLDMFGSFALLPVGYILVGRIADWIGGTTTMGIFAGIGLVIVLSALTLPAIRRFQ